MDKATQGPSRVIRFNLEAFQIYYECYAITAMLLFNCWVNHSKGPACSSRFLCGKISEEEVSKRRKGWQRPRRLSSAETL